MNISPVSNQQNQSFKGAYVKWNKVWHDLTQKTKVSSEVIKDKYQEAEQKKILLLNSNSAIFRLQSGAWYISPIKKLPVILTNNDAKLYEQIKTPADEKTFFNKLLKEDVLEFQVNLSSEPTEKIDSVL